MSIFSDVLVKKPGRSLFNLNHEKKFSCDFGYLYPILVMEAVPGDTFKINTEAFIRTAPLIAPVMHRINVKFNYFFVPNRLLWSEWKDFITGINQNGTYNPSSADQSDYFVTKVPPYYTFNASASTTAQAYFKDGSLADFLGFPTMRSNQTFDGSFNVQVLPFRAYQQIYNDWFRNQNVEATNNFLKTSGLQTANQVSLLFPLRKRMWEKDYFTSALPFAQRGDAVKIPIADFEYVPGEVTKLMTYQGDELPESANNRNLQTTKMSSGDDEYDGLSVNTGSSVVPINIDNSANLNVNIGTINDLRIATRLQRWLEINARVGGRYIEQVLGHFGVHSSDARLDRSEYLGGWSQPIVVQEVEQNSATASSGTPQGNLAGKGVAYGKKGGIKCFCEEHGFIIGIMSILPRTSYQDGLPRMFNRNYKEDYYFPEFANLGEQEIKKSELYFPLNNNLKRSTTDSRFGFQERYCEYKYIPSTVHGEFKGSLDFWHLGRIFDNVPALNKTFVEANPRNDIFAVEEGANHFYVNLYNEVKAIRPMPKQAIPSL